MAELDLNPQFKRAIQLIEEGQKNLFITGKAGTGKSTLLDYYRSRSKKKPVILAPTGVSALNVKGQTIHSFFNFYIDVSPEKIKKQKKAKQPELYKNLKSLVIDEVSMVRADLMDCVETFLRKFGPRKGAPFGGVQMIFVGDLLQLPPIVKAEEKILFSSHYKSPFFFSSQAFESLEFETLELKKVYRQKDQIFIDLLNRIRSKTAGDKDIKLLNSRFQPGFEPKTDEFYISLCSRNKTANSLNEKRLRELKGPVHTSPAFIEGDLGKEYYPTSAELSFKIGAQIMLINNDSKRRWVNGTVGVIESSGKNWEFLNVRLYPHKNLVPVYQKTWDIYRFSLAKDKKSIVSEPAGSFTQFPFRLAWAITIHKSQGKTFDRVILDFSQGMFAGGQAYVALSRCSSLEGIVLKSPFKKQHIQMDSRALDFLNSLQ